MVELARVFVDGSLHPQVACGTGPRPHPTSHECILMVGRVGARASAAKVSTDVETAPDKNSNTARSPKP